ncbi:TRAP transporter large permease subunit [Chelatococcus sp. GCM10030263]|uniref:TRAP transporter large permease subunit n=1 Tax=Chelatococcus sp. GCM10030263 TaxID=3273387 RepID=UPI00361EFF3B
MNLCLFFIGMLIETSAAIIVLAPILAPVAASFGIDPVNFGMVMVVNLALGMITPPFSVNLFAACAVARISLDRMIPAICSIRSISNWRSLASIALNWAI